LKQNDASVKNVVFTGLSNEKG